MRIGGIERREMRRSETSGVTTPGSSRRGSGPEGSGHRRSPAFWSALAALASRRGAARAALRRAVLAIVLLGASFAQSQAQSEDVRYPHLERLFRPAPTAPAPSEQIRRPRERVERRPLVVHPEAAAREVAPTFVVAVLGDAMALMLADGLKEALAVERPDIGVLRKGRDSSGLVRDDYYDWRKAARELAAGQEKIDYALVMMGANDRQPLKDADGATLEPLSPRWREIYARRVEEVLAPFRARAIPVVWVGLPIMKSERYGADVMALNEIARAATQKAGAVFIDVWERFADESGQFSALGPDVTGREARLRTADGIHFTRAGSVKLAHFVQDDILRRAGPAPQPAVSPPSAFSPTPDPAQNPSLVPPPPLARLGPTSDAPETDVTALVLSVVRRENEARRAAEDLLRIPLPEATSAPYFPMKPAAGPTAALTVAPLAPDGRLAVGRPPADPGSPHERALVEGRPLDARPGRADDVSWPKR
jgi:hypothetical protein